MKAAEPQAYFAAVILTGGRAKVVTASWACGGQWRGSCMNGSMVMQCRLKVRGFKDELQDLETHAGTTSRSGHRIDNCIAAENLDVVLLSFEV